MNQEQLNTARAASFVALTNAVTLVAEVVRQTVGNDAADPDVNKRLCRWDWKMRLLRA